MRMFLERGLLTREGIGVNQFPSVTFPSEFVLGNFFFVLDTLLALLFSESLLILRIFILGSCISSSGYPVLACSLCSHIIILFGAQIFFDVVTKAVS